MKSTKQLRKQFTRQFYKGNGIYLALAMLQTITVVAANLFIAWLMQQLVDTATGAASNFTLKQIGIITQRGEIQGGVLTGECGNAFLRQLRKDKVFVLAHGLGVEFGHGIVIQNSGQDP